VRDQNVGIERIVATAPGASDKVVEDLGHEDFRGAMRLWFIGGKNERR